MSKLIPFHLANVQTGERQLHAYVDAAEIVSWHEWRVPDSTPPGVSREFRGKTLVTLNLRPGAVHWTEEDFDSVSAKILHARGQDEEAATHGRAAAAAEARKPGKSLSVV